MLSSMDMSALWLTLQLATVSTVILLIIAAPLAWWLSQSQWRFKILVEAAVALPLVLPPTVIGFYLLLLLSPQGAVGTLVTALGLQPLVFSFSGLVIGSIIYSLPFVVHPIKNAMVAIGRQPFEMAATLGASPWQCFIRLALPLARPGFMSAAVLGFAHTLGEFGVVLMLGGNIPGQTQVASIAIYEHVETLQYAQAHRLAALLLLISFVLLLLVYIFNRQTLVRSQGNGL